MFVYLHFFTSINTFTKFINGTLLGKKNVVATLKTSFIETRWTEFSSFSLSLSPSQPSISILGRLVKSVIRLLFSTISLCINEQKVFSVSHIVENFIKTKRFCFIKRLFVNNSGLSKTLVYSGIFDHSPCFGRNWISVKMDTFELTSIVVEDVVRMFSSIWHKVSWTSS